VCSPPEPPSAHSPAAGGSGDTVKTLCCTAICLFLLLLLTSIEALADDHLHVIRLTLATSSGQEFVCVSPYTIPECKRQVSVLRPVLDRYHAELAGKWTWVLVRSEDWNQITTQLHLNPNSPAFSHLDMRQTFFEEVLLTPKPDRQMQLLEIWHIPFPEFLDVAVTHELGHALCHEPDEAKADRAGQRLRRSQPGICETRKQKAFNVARSSAPRE